MPKSITELGGPKMANVYQTAFGDLITKGKHKPQNHTRHIGHACIWGSFTLPEAKQIMTAAGAPDDIVVTPNSFETAILVLAKAKPEIDRTSEPVGRVKAKMADTIENAQACHDKIVAETEVPEIFKKHKKIFLDAVSRERLKSNGFSTENINAVLN
jgi:hypothetical protein